MTVIVKELHDALIEAGASPAQASKAAEAVAASGDTATGADLATAKAELRAEIHALKAELFRALWMQGLGIVAATVTLLKLIP